MCIINDMPHIIYLSNVHQRKCEVAMVGFSERAYFKNDPIQKKPEVTRILHFCRHCYGTKCSTYLCLVYLKMK